MRELAEELGVWWRDGTTFALGTVVGTWSSSPRQPGAAMAVDVHGAVVGSVSGGCVEGAVYELAEVVRDGEPAVLQRYGVSDDDAFAVGLTCGGIIDVFVEAINQNTFSEFGSVIDNIAAARPVAVATVIAAPEAHAGLVGRHLVIRPDGIAGSLGNAGLDATVTQDGLGLLDKGRTQSLRVGPDGLRSSDEVSVFVSSFAPAPRMIVFGAVDFSRAVARIGAFLGYHVTVCDARATFATKKRFPEADEVVVDWPHRYLSKTEVDERTVICVLTHDPKFDLPLLEIALRLPVAYVGVMGSRRTNENRIALLREREMSDEEIARMHAPIGLDIGGRTPEETAVSIAAEIIATQWGGSGAKLVETSGPIHSSVTGGAARE